MAGIGGSVALKGSDGERTVREALSLGAVPHAPERALTALRVLDALADRLHVLTAPGTMGEDEARAAGLHVEVVGSPNRGRFTSAADTREAVGRMLGAGVDLVLFAGGDGTARDICDALAGQDTPVVGIPAGVKIHSAVYAASPAAAGELARRWLDGTITRLVDLEVMDIDEDACRRGEVLARLYGYLRVPEDRSLTQGAKVGGRGLSDAAAAQAIAERVVESMSPGRLYLIGPGTTTRAIKDRLGLQGTLLGVDAVLDGSLAARDATEAELLALLPPGRDATIVVTVIGGQGYIFGRGNQQLSPGVIRRVSPENVLVVATTAKLAALPFGRLRVDTGDSQLDGLLSGYRRVVTSYAEEAVLRVE